MLSHCSQKGRSFCAWNDWSCRETASLGDTWQIVQNWSNGTRATMSALAVYVGKGGKWSGRGKLIINEHVVGPASAVKFVFSPIFRTTSAPDLWSLFCITDERESSAETVHRKTICSFAFCLCTLDEFLLLLVLLLLLLTDDKTVVTGKFK